MKQLDLFNQGSVDTMSSKEIAELTGKRHSHVLRDIDNMLNSLELQPTQFWVRYQDAKGEWRRCYNLPKRETLILASGYNVKLRAAIIDRWAELEIKEQIQLPQTFAQALQLAADQAKQLELQAPKVQFAEKILETESCISVASMAKLMGLGQNKLFKKLRDSNILITGGQHHNVPYQRFINAGYFEITERSWMSEKGEGISLVTRVTTKGQQYLTNKFGN